MNSLAKRSSCGPLISNQQANSRKCQDHESVDKMNPPQKGQDERGNNFLHLSKMNGNGYHQIEQDLMKRTLVNQNQKLVPRPGETKLAKI